jgi:hypothetical protein
MEEIRSFETSVNSRSTQGHIPEDDILRNIIYLVVEGITLLTYLRSWVLPEKLPIVQPFRKLPEILRNPKVHHRVHKSPPLVPILSQLDAVPTIPSYLSLRSILILSTHLRLGLPSVLFPSGFPTNILYAFLVSPIRATCPAHLILITLIKYSYIVKKGKVVPVLN